MNNNKVKNEIEKLVSQWSADYQAAGAPVVKRIIELINKGSAASKAIDQALKESGFFGEIRDNLYNSLFTAAAKGYGILPEIVAEVSKAQIIEKLVNLPWAADKMPLSTRLHGTERIMRTQIVDTIRNNMKSGTNITKLSRSLYEGYDHSRIIKPAEMPKYLKKIIVFKREISALNRITPISQNNRELLEKFVEIAEMNVEGLKTRPLKAAYRRLLEKVRLGTHEEFEKAVWVAVQEKSRYYAERIARTETARAWSDGFYAETYDDETVIAYKWKLSRAHKIFDVCDFHAKADLYGLGKGIYPINSVPPHPAHPHCTCMIEAVYDGELDTKRLNKQVQKNGNKYIESLTKGERLKLMTREGNAAFTLGKDWRSLLNNWQGLEDPNPRLTKLDFNERKE